MAAAGPSWVSRPRAKRAGAQPRAGPRASRPAPGLREVSPRRPGSFGQRPRGRRSSSLRLWTPAAATRHQLYFLARGARGPEADGAGGAVLLARPYLLSCAVALAPPRPGPDWRADAGSRQPPRHHPCSRSRAPVPRCSPICHLPRVPSSAARLMSVTSFAGPEGPLRYRPSVPGRRQSLGCDAP